VGDRLCQGPLELPLHSSDSCPYNCDLGAETALRRLISGCISSDKLVTRSDTREAQVAPYRDPICGRAKGLFSALDRTQMQQTGKTLGRPADVGDACQRARPAPVARMNSWSI